ncbi:hypothetical protein Scep_009720 [Stephania cephalantha]|uniref:Epidermal patterning factor-like protein n=1 Tax=Stephania cephalantha TaxID=152367 RepID=A0AAP0JUD3_9MAGN
MCPFITTPLLRCRGHTAIITTTLALLLFVAAAVSATLRHHHAHLGGDAAAAMGQRLDAGVVGVGRRRKLVGPGSAPPTCRSKCGKCRPCKAVHVPIHPGLSFPLEYYPEAWRCKCGNKLFMP